MFYPVRLSLIGKGRLAYTNVTPAEFIGMLASYLRDKVPVNNSSYIEGVDDQYVQEYQDMKKALTNSLDF